MPAEVLFAGGRLDSVVPFGVIAESTLAATIDSSYADASLLTASNSPYFDCGFFTETVGVLSAATVISGETLWCHFDFYHATNPATTANVWVIHDSSNFPRFRFTLTSASVFQAQYNSGTGAAPVWTNVGSTWTYSGATRVTLDTKLTLGSPHSFEFSVASSLTLSGTFTQASFTNAAKLRIHGFGNANGYHSQIMATRDISTIGAKVKYSRATANGTNTAWAGVFSDVNEAVGSDVTVNSAATAGLKETHAMGDITLGAGSEVKAVFQWFRAKNDGAAPTNIKSLLRSGGVDYSTGNLAGIGTSFGAIGARYTQDPATASNWTQAGWNAVEAGFESAA